MSYMGGLGVGRRGCCVLMRQQTKGCKVAYFHFQSRFESTYSTSQVKPQQQHALQKCGCQINATPKDACAMNVTGSWLRENASPCSPLFQTASPTSLLNSLTICISEALGTSRAPRQSPIGTSMCFNCCDTGLMLF